MKKHIRFIAGGLLLLPFALHAQDFPQAEKNFADGNFAKALPQYEKILQTATGNDLFQARLRKAACQYGLGEYLNAYKTMYAYPLPENEIWKARFLLYRAQMAQRAANLYRPILNDGEILTETAQKDPEQWTKKQWNAQIDKDYNTLWALRAALINAPIEQETLILDVKDTDTFRIPTLFDFTVQSWLQYLKTQDVQPVPITKESYAYLDGAALLDKTNRRAQNALQTAEILETAYLLDGKNRQNAKIFWKTDYIKLPFNNSAFEIKNKQQAAQNAVTQLDLLSGKTAVQQRWWNKLKGYVAPSPSTAYARGYAALQTARLQFDNKQAPEALQTCEFALEKLPASYFTQECGDLRETITRVSLNLQNLNAPVNRKAPKLTVTGRNLHNAYLRLYKTSLDELTELYRKTNRRGTLNSWEYLSRLNEENLPVFLDRVPLYKQTLSVPYQEVYKKQKAVFALPELKKGFYIAAVSYDENFDPKTAPVEAMVLNATDLAFFTTVAIEADPADYTAVLGEKDKNLRPNVFHLYTVNLKTGKPEPAAQLDMFTSWQGARQKAQTDEQGYAAFQRPVTVTTDERSGSPYILNTLAKKDGSVAYSARTLYFNFYNNDPVKLFAQTDRPVYRPAQKVRLSVNAFQTLPRGLKTLGGREVTFTVKDPNYKTVFTASPVLDELGTAQAEMTIPKSDLLGRYEVEVSLVADGRTYRAHHSFTTEEYKRPDYELTLSVPEKALEYGKTAAVTGTAKYYFGSPLQNAQVKYTVQRQDYLPPFYWWLRIFRLSSETIAQGETKTDEKGNFKVEFTPTTAEKNEEFAEYIVKAEAFDESGRAVNATRSYKVSAKPHLFQVEFTQGFYDAETAGTLAKINLTDADGRGVSGKITAEAVRLKNEIPPATAPDQDGKSDVINEVYYYNTPDTLSLDDYYKNAKAGQTVFKQELNFKTAGAQTISLPALPEGVYRLKLSSAQAAPQEMVFVVVGENSALNLPEVTLVQHPKYFVGETMRVLIGAGKLQGSKRVEIYQDNGKFLYKKDLLSGGASVYSLPVTDQLRGGVSLAWFGASGYEFFRGETSVEIPFDNKELAVTFTLPQTVRPAETVSWKLSVKNSFGAPVNGQANITVYDKSLDYYIKNNPSLAFSNLYSQRQGQAGFTQSNAFASRISCNRMPTERKKRLNEILLPALNLQMRRHHFFLGVHKSMNMARSAAPMTASAGSAKQEAALVAEETTFNTADFALDDAHSVSRDAGETENAVLGVQTAGSENNTQQTVEPRTDFAETAYFNSQLPVTGGQAAVKFTMPQSLTAWNIFGFVLTKTADFGAFTAQTLTQKDFMVHLQTPRFYREGDKGVIQAAVTNLTKKKLAVQVTLSVQQDGKNALAAFGLTNTPKTVSVAAESTQFVTWEITAPSAPALYTLTAAARAGKSADAEQKTLPVLAGKTRLLATVNKALKNGKDTLTLDELDNVDPKDVETVALTVNPSLALSVLSSMPNLLTSPYKDLVSTLNRYVPLAVVNKFYTTYPKLKEAVKKLPKRDGKTAAWDEQDPLRLTLLEQTPWLRQAQGRKVADIIDLFNAQIVSSTLAKEMKQIAKFQNASGAFTWFAGGPDDDYLTLYALAQFAQALAYDAQIPQTEAKKAFAYIVPRIEKRLQEDKEGSVGAVSYALYAAYTLSAFPPNWAQTAEAKPYVKRWADYADKQARFMTPLGQIYAAAVYHRLGDDVKAARYLEMVLSRMKQDELSGAYFAPEPQSWIWYNDTLSTQTVTLQTLLEMRPDSDKIDPMTQWLLFNRQVNDWTDTKAAAQAVFTLLNVMKAKGAMSLPSSYNINWAGEQKALTFEPFDWTKDLQFTRTGSEITPAAFTASVAKQSKMTDFASLSAVYQSSDAKASPKGILNVSREYFLRKKQGDEIQLRPIKDLSEVSVGDEIDVRLTLTTNSAFEYVHLQDPKPAGFESEELLSGWEWGNVRFYRENRDAATNFFINWLPNGTVTMHYILRPTAAGKFRALPAQVQSMYAPEFGAHSASETLRVTK